MLDSSRLLQQGILHTLMDIFQAATAVHAVTSVTWYSSMADRFAGWFWCGWREEVATVTRTVVNKLTPGFTTSSAPIVLQQEVKEEEEEEEEEESRTRRRAIREEERVRKKKEGKGGGAGREGEGETHEKGKHMKREKKNEEVE